MVSNKTSLEKITSLLNKGRAAEESIGAVEEVFESSGTQGDGDGDMGVLRQPQLMKDLMELDRHLCPFWLSLEEADIYEWKQGLTQEEAQEFEVKINELKELQGYFLKLLEFTAGCGFPHLCHVVVAMSKVLEFSKHPRFRDDFPGPQFVVASLRILKRSAWGLAKKTRGSSDGSKGSANLVVVQNSEAAFLGYLRAFAEMMEHYVKYWNATMFPFCNDFESHDNRSLEHFSEITFICALLQCLDGLLTSLHQQDREVELPFSVAKGQRARGQRHSMAWIAKFYDLLE